MKLFSSLAFAPFARLASLASLGPFGVLLCLLVACPVDQVDAQQQVEAQQQVDAQQADAKRADGSLSVLRIQGGDTYRGKLAASQNPQQL
ncbi:MAG: hypothetical protein DWI26_02145, partial [Planctomycetota bacterium]